MAEVLQKWFYMHHNSIRDLLQVEENRAECIAAGEIDQRQLGVGEKVAITMGDGCRHKLGPGPQALDYVGHLGTFEECVALAVQRLPELKVSEGFDWAIVLGAEIVGTDELGEHHLIVTDPKEYHLMGSLEPGQFLDEHRTEEYWGFNFLPMGLPMRHPVSSLLIYPSRQVRRRYRDCVHC